MKRFLFTVLTLCLLVGAGAQGQELQDKSILFVGLNYDEGIGADVGYGGTIVDGVLGGKIYGFGRLKWGETAVSEDSVNNFGNAGFEVALIWPSGNFYYGLLLDPLKIDWLNVGDIGWTTYGTYALGGIAGVNFSEKIGFSVNARYNADYQRSLFEDGVSGGAHLHFKLGS